MCRILGATTVACQVPPATHGSGTPVIYVPARVAALGIQPLAIEHQHALHAATLPGHHRDPFDRLLVAQARLDDLPILTADPLIRAYEVATIAAMGT
jgi:PIN domain nuclease of toxin-antitoxin system